MKILFILENYYPNVGGLETLFKHLAEELASQGHLITIITNRNDPSFPAVEKTLSLTVRRYNFINRYFFTVLAIFPAIRQATRHDLIHTTSYNAGVPAYLSALFTRKKCIITFHEVWNKLWFRLPFFNRFQMTLHYLFEKLLLRLPFNRFVAVSDYTRDQLRSAGIPDQRVLRIYNGIDYENYQEQPDQGNSSIFRFLYFGRLGISKGLDILLPATKILADSTVDFGITLVIPKKPAKLYGIIRHKVEALGISDQVSFRHHLSVDDLHRQIVSSQAVVIPSYSEGFCFVAVEAMALGVPIISSGQGALAEVVGGRHLTYSPQNDPNALALCMQMARKGQWRQAPMKRFPLSETVNDYVNLYHQVVNEPQ